MKLHTLLLIGLAAGIVGCAEKEEAATQPEYETEPAEPAVPIAEPAEEPAADPDVTYAKVEEWRDAALLDHMHAHAEQLDDLNFALDDGNLERAGTSAYWLARHDTVRGLPEELQPFVDSMREAAYAVETAADIDSARAGARKIATACQGCHKAAGVAVE